jgi:hypothetical protein
MVIGSTAFSGDFHDNQYEYWTFSTNVFRSRNDSYHQFSGKKRSTPCFESFAVVAHEAMQRSDLSTKEFVKEHKVSLLSWRITVQN